MNVLKPNKRTTVATLLETGTSQREIARLTGVDRKTNRRLALGPTGPEPNFPTLATGSVAAKSPSPATGNRHRPAIAVRTASRLHRRRPRIKLSPQPVGWLHGQCPRKAQGFKAMTVVVDTREER